MAWLSGDRLPSCEVVAAEAAEAAAAATALAAVEVATDIVCRFDSQPWDRLPNDDLQLSVFVSNAIGDANVADVVVIVGVIEVNISFGCVVLWIIFGFIRADV